jgi:hypothetical protein
VSQSTSTSHKPSITARPTADEKRRFGELAARRDISESAIALIAIRALLDDNPIPVGAAIVSTERAPSTDRITIRLRHVTLAPFISAQNVAEYESPGAPPRSCVPIFRRTRNSRQTSLSSFGVFLSQRLVLTTALTPNVGWAEKSHDDTRSIGAQRVA